MNRNGSVRHLVPLSGVYVPVIPALDDAGAIDPDAISAFVSSLADGGVDGFWINGTMGELAALERADWQQVVRATIAASALPVVVHVGHNSTREATSRAREAADSGAAAVSVITPYLLTATFDELRSHLQTVRAAVELPVLLYLYPQLTHYDLSESQLWRLISDGLIDGMKDSSGDIIRLRLLIEATRAGGLDVAIFGASGDAVDLFHAVGCKGVVTGVANIMPRSVAGLWSDISSGALRPQVISQQTISRVLALMRCCPRSVTGAGWIAMYRYLLHRLGAIPSSLPMAPTSPVGDAEATCLEEALELITMSEDACERGAATRTRP